MDANDTPYCCFMLVRATEHWLALNPDERFGFVGSVLGPILERRSAVRLRYFDSEAFHARCSDVMMWETSELGAYQAVVEDLRETPFWGHYFEVVDIIASVENGYARHYGRAPVGATAPAG